MRLRAWVTTIAAGLAIAGSAAAEDAAEAIQLQYSAGGDCPDRSAFEARIHAQTSRARFVPAGQSRTFEVSMRGGAHASGKVTVLRAGSIEGVRNVTGESCAEVAEELALVVTLAIDPAAIARAAQTPTAVNAGVAGTTAAPTTSAPAEQPAVPPSPAPPPAPIPLATEKPGAPRADESSSSASVRPAPHTLFLGIDASLAEGVTSSSLVAVAPLVGWRASSHGWLAPSLQASFARTSTGTIAASGGASSSFTWTVGRLDGCSFSWPPGPAHLLGCVRIEAGVLGATGTGIPGARSIARGWAAAGPLVRGEWELLGPLFIAADVAPMLRLTTDRFLFLPDTTIYTVPAVGLEADAGVGVYFL